MNEPPDKKPFGAQYYEQIFVQVAWGLTAAGLWHFGLQDFAVGLIVVMLVSIHYAAKNPRH